MALKKGRKIKRGYSTVTDDDGVNYREIAATMTELGFKMNHSSARNHVMRVVRKFASALAPQLVDTEISDAELNELAKNPNFQQGVADLLRVIEVQRRLHQS